MDHFRRWGLEVHAGSYHPFKGSKTELLFCSRPLSTYQDPSTCDNTDMTDLILPNGRFVPVVTKFKYLGSYISSDGSDTIDVQSRIDYAARAFGALSKCIFRSQNIDRKAKSAIYTTKLTAGLSAGLSALGWYSNYRAGSSNYLADSSNYQTREADNSTISLVLPGW